MAGEAVFSYDRARLAKVRDMLAKGESPYAHISNGGASPIRSQLKSVEVEPSQERIESLETKWRSGEGPTLRCELPKIDDLQLWTEEELKPRDPMILHCTFCGKPTSESVATRGKTTKMFFKDEVKEINGVKVIESKAIFRTIKVVACQACALKIQPIVHRDGSISNTLEVPSYE